MTVSASAIDVPLEALFDRTAVLAPDVQHFHSAGSPHTWTKPVLAKWVEMILVGGGGGGGKRTSYSGGSAGGSSGMVVRRIFQADEVPTTLSVYTGTGGNTATSTNPTSSYVQGDSDRFLVTASAGTNGASSTSSAGAAATPGSATDWGDVSRGGGAGGGVDGTGSSGESGYCCVAAPGGTGGATAGLGGTGGYGYGGGGGGGGGYDPGEHAGGGGGGGGGYGSVIRAGSGETYPSFLGGAGASGIVIITTFRGP